MYCQSIIYFIYFPRNPVDMKSNLISYSSLLYLLGWLTRDATDSSSFVEDLVDRQDDATEVVSATSVFLLDALVERRVEEAAGLDVSSNSSPPCTTGNVVPFFPLVTMLFGMDFWPPLLCLLPRDLLSVSDSLLI
jgi:hypothetical protein